MGIDSSILCLQAISSMKTHFFLLASKQLIFVHFICFLVNLCNKKKSLLSIYLSPNSTCVFEGIRKKIRIISMEIIAVIEVQKGRNEEIRTQITQSK